MLAKYALGALIAAMAHGATAEFSGNCSWWNIKEEVTLYGICNPPHSHQLFSTALDLNKCIGIDEKSMAMTWKPNGRAFLENIYLRGEYPVCRNCILQHDLPTLRCECIHVVASKKTNSTINLNDRISVNDQGQLTC